MPTCLTLRPPTDDETRAIDRLAHARTESALPRRCARARDRAHARAVRGDGAAVALALKGRRLATREEVCRAVERATAYWNTHHHPFLWGSRRKRRRAARSAGLVRLPLAAETCRMDHFVPIEGCPRNA